MELIQIFSVERDEIKLPTAVYFRFCLIRNQCSVRQNVPELVKTFTLKRLQLITGKMGRNLIIFFEIRVAKWTWEGVFVTSCTFQRVTNSH